MADPPSHFFKFIRPGHKFNLSIPRSFWTKLNRGRCEKATLRRGCHEWAVVISEEGGFRDGWRKFVRDNGVQEFDFIVFKHQGNMLFDFMVFDQSSCERQYPCLYEEMDVEQPLTESDSIYTHKRTKKLKKRKKTVYSSQNEDKFGVDDDRCFVTIMTPYYIKEARLHIPMKFARRNGLIMQSTLTQIVIIDEAQRSWPATLEMGRTHIRLRGLRKLIMKNHLELGDMCMFKLVENGEVTIFNVYHLGKKPIENFIHVKKETSSAPKSNPYFISTLKPCTFVASRLYLPLKFSRPNGLKIGEMILRDYKNRSWKVQLNKDGNGHFCLGSGLRSFCNENGLRVGDGYKFELVKNEKDKPPVVNFSYLGKKPVTKLIQAKKEPSSTLPYFMSTLKPYFKKSGLYLPAEFSLSNGLKVGEMVLNDDKGRSWKVWLNKNGVNTLSLRDGFGAFSVENGLKEGDAFKFEIIENEKDKPPVANFSLNCEDVPPCFIARVKSCNIEKSILNLPNKFAEENGLINKEEMLLGNVKDERTWTVKLERSITNSCYLGRGWKDFHVANGLKKGDRFKLELVENGEKPIANFYLEEIRQS